MADLTDDIAMVRKRAEGDNGVTGAVCNVVLHLLDREQDASVPERTCDDSGAMCPKHGIWRGRGRAVPAPEPATGVGWLDALPTDPAPEPAVTDHQTTLRQRLGTAWWTCACGSEGPVTKSFWYARTDGDLHVRTAERDAEREDNARLRAGIEEELAHAEAAGFVHGPRRLRALLAGPEDGE